MQYTIVNADYISSVWFECYGPKESINLGLVPALEINARFSPSTDWEKVFSLGDQINKDLNLTERDVLNEIRSFRNKRKTKK